MSRYVAEGWPVRPRIYKSCKWMCGHLRVAKKCMGVSSPLLGISTDEQTLFIEAHTRVGLSGDFAGRCRGCLRGRKALRGLREVEPNLAVPGALLRAGSGQADTQSRAQPPSQPQEASKQKPSWCRLASTCLTTGHRFRSAPGPATRARGVARKEISVVARSVLYGYGVRHWRQPNRQVG